MFIGHLSNFRLDQIGGSPAYSLAKGPLRTPKYRPSDNRVHCRLIMPPGGAPRQNEPSHAGSLLNTSRNGRCTNADTIRAFACVIGSRSASHVSNVAESIRNSCRSIAFSWLGRSSIAGLSARAYKSASRESTPNNETPVRSIRSSAGFAIIPEITPINPTTNGFRAADSEDVADNASCPALNNTNTTNAI